MDNWLINLLVLLLFAVVLDGARRAFFKHRETIKFLRKRSRPQPRQEETDNGDILTAARTVGSVKKSAVSVNNADNVLPQHPPPQHPPSQAPQPSQIIPEPEFIDPEEQARQRQLTAELPSSVRVVQRRREEDVSQLNRKVQENFYSSRKPLAGSKPAREFAKQIPGFGNETINETTNEPIKERANQEAGESIVIDAQAPEQKPLNLGDQVPTLMDSVAEQRREPSLDESLSIESLQALPIAKETDLLTSAESESVYAASSKPLGQPISEKPARRFNPAAAKPTINKVAQTDETVPLEREVEEVLILNIVAPAGDCFEGNDLLRVLLSSGFRFGDMNIFHYNTGEAGKGPALFSLANLVVPGTFDLTQMEDFTSPGVSLFLALPVAGGEALKALDILLATARTVAEQLGGEFKDEDRSVFTAQTAEHYRQRVVEFQRRKALARAQV